MVVPWEGEESRGITAGVRLSSGRAGVVQKLGAFSRVGSAVVGGSEEVGWRQDVNGGAR